MYSHRRVRALKSTISGHALCEAAFHKWGQNVENLWRSGDKGIASFLEYRRPYIEESVLPSAYMGYVQGARH